MPILKLTLSQSIYKQVEELSENEGVSLDQFVTAALAEKLLALMTQDCLEARARKGDREAFERVLGKVPDVEPGERGWL